MTTHLETLLRLALDPSAGAAQSESAAIAFIRTAREQGETVETLCGADKPAHQPASHPGEPVFPFGKFKGVPLKDVDEGYIEWALGNMTKLSPGFRRALEEELEGRD